MPSVKEMILSEEYADLILPVYTGFLEDYKEYGQESSTNITASSTTLWLKNFFRIIMITASFIIRFPNCLHF